MNQEHIYQTPIRTSGCMRKKKKIFKPIYPDDVPLFKLVSPHHLCDRDMKFCSVVEM